MTWMERKVRLLLKRQAEQGKKLEEISDKLWQFPNIVRAIVNPPNVDTVEAETPIRRADLSGSFDKPCGIAALVCKGDIGKSNPGDILRGKGYLESVSSDMIIIDEPVPISDILDKVKDIRNPGLEDA